MEAVSAPLTAWQTFAMELSAELERVDADLSACVEHEGAAALRAYRGELVVLAAAVESKISSF
jgi:hypothetical protein